MSNILGEFIKHTRVEKSLSTPDVERGSGGRISASYISRIESGRIANVSPEKLDALAAGLGIDPDAIYRVARGRAPEPPKERMEILAETFGGEELSEQDWTEIEAVLKVLIDQKRAARSAAKEK